MDRIAPKEAFKYCLMALGILFLADSLRGLVAYIFYDTRLFNFIFYSPVSNFGWVDFIQTLWLPVIYFNEWVNGLFRFHFFNDPHNFTGVFLVFPILEEIQFRGPLYLLRDHSSKNWWKILTLVSCVVFTLIHDRGIGMLIPVFIFSLLSVWLIKKTDRFWPSILVHSAFNVCVSFFLYFMSVTMLPG